MTVVSPSPDEPVHRHPGDERRKTFPWMRTEIRMAVQSVLPVTAVIVVEAVREYI